MEFRDRTIIADFTVEGEQARNPNPENVPGLARNVDTIRRYRIVFIQIERLLILLVSLEILLETLESKAL